MKRERTRTSTSAAAVLVVQALLLAILAVTRVAARGTYCNGCASSHDTFECPANLICVEDCQPYKQCLCSCQANITQTSWLFASFAIGAIAVCAFIFYALAQLYRVSSDDTLTQLVAGSQSDSHVGAESASASRPVRKGPKVNLARARKSTGVPAPNTSPPASPVAAPAVSPAVHTAVGLDQPDLYVGSAAAAASSAAGDLIAEHSVSVDIGMLPPVAPFTHGAHAVDDASADSAPARVAADAAVEPTTSEVAEAEDDTSEPKRKRGRPSKSVKSKPSSRSKSRTRRQKQEDDEEESAAEDDDDDEEYVDDQSAAAEESTPADKSKRKRARVTPRRAIKKERVHVDDEAEDGADAGTASGLIPPPSGVVEEAPLPPEKRTLLSILNDTRAGTPSRSAVERRRRKRLEIEARNAKLKSESTKVEGEDAAPAASVEEEAPEIEAPTPKKSGAIQMRIVDGRMVIAEESLVLAQQDSSSNYDQPFENNRTVTSASYTNRQKCEQWTQEETKLFYKSLAQYGTDFTFISQMFPKRTRRQVKNKFKREEKENQYLIDAALKKKIPIDEAEFLARMAECNAVSEAKKKKAEEEEAERLRKEEEAKRKLEEEERKADSDEDDDDDDDDEEEEEEEAEEAADEQKDIRAALPSAGVQTADDDAPQPMDEED